MWDVTILLASLWVAFSASSSILELRYIARIPIFIQYIYIYIFATKRVNKIYRQNTIQCYPHFSTNGSDTSSCVDGLGNMVWNDWGNIDADNHFAMGHISYGLEQRG